MDEECYAGFRTAVHALGTLDALLSLSTVAKLPGYVRPNYRPTLPSADNTDDAGDGADAPATGDDVDDVDEIVLRGARHPTVERVLEGGFVPNDINLRWVSYVYDNRCAVVGVSPSAALSWVRGTSRPLLRSKIFAYK